MEEMITGRGQFVVLVGTQVVKITLHVLGRNEWLKLLAEREVGR